MELVTEPTFNDAEIAAKIASNFAKELQLILWYLGVSEANMEKGEASGGKYLFRKLPVGLRPGIKIN